MRISDWSSDVCSSDLPAANQKQDTTDYGFVGEYRLGLWDRLFLSGAVRFDENDGFRDATTWRATAAYVFPEAGTRFHGRHATGVPNPNFFELFGFNPTGRATWMEREWPDESI